MGTPLRSPIPLAKRAPPQRASEPPPELCDPLLGAVSGLVSQKCCPPLPSQSLRFSASSASALLAGPARGAVAAQGHQPATLPSPRLSRFHQIKLVPLASTTQAPLCPAAVAAVGAPSRSPIPSPKRAPQRVSSTARPCVAKREVSQHCQLRR